MKIKIFFSNLIYDQNNEISLVELKWQEKDLIFKKNFTYYQLEKDILLFNAFKKYHPELFM